MSREESGSGGKMKRIVILVMAVFLSLTMLAACGNRADNDDGKDDSGGKDDSKPSVIQPDPERFPTREIQKEVGKDFVILQLSDIQIDSEHNNGSAENTWHQAAPLMTKMVEDVNPDMIVLIGDNIGGNHDHDLAVKLIELMDSYEVPWLPIFGNHERDIVAKDGKPGLEWMGDRFTESEYCLYDRGKTDFTPDGNYPYYGNYTVSLMEGKNTIYSFVMMDSGWLYGGFSYEQVDWYEEQVKGVSARQYGEYDLSKGNVVPTMMFFHIPIEEFGFAAKAAFGNESGKGIVPASIGSGENREEAGHEQRENVGMFDRALSLGSTTHMFCGHKHRNSASIPYNGIVTTFGVKSSYNNSHDKDMVGCTVITIADASCDVAVIQKKYTQEEFGWKPL